MNHPSIASCTALAFGLATLAATFSQCGDASGSEPAANRAANAQDPVPAAADAPRPTTPPPPDAIRILISGAMNGHLEPCGCASGQLGGLARRMQHIGEQRSYDLLLEGGDLVGGSTELDVLKLFTQSQVLFGMQRSYDALGVGLRDLRMGDEWSAFLATAPVVASNLTSSDPSWPARPFVDKQVRDYTVRIASLLLPELPEALRGDGATLQRKDPGAAWREVFRGADDEVIRIAMLYGDDAPIRALLPDLEPRPDLAIAVDPAYIEPNAVPVMIDDVPLVYAGIRGRVLLDARLWREQGKPRVACELVPLAASKTLPGGGGDPQVRDVILQHRHDVKESGLLASMAEQTDPPGGNTYIGTAICKNCHRTAYDAWANSKHGHAWQTLVDAEKDPKRYGWPVTAYPDCVGCHVVGYGQKSGFVTYEETPELADVGCERCHGPGSGHLTSGGKQKLGIIGGEQASVMCTQCHDYEQSPNFVYNERWALIEHGLEPEQQAARDQRK